VPDEVCRSEAGIPPTDAAAAATEEEAEGGAGDDGAGIESSDIEPDEEADGDAAPAAVGGTPIK
jgi:hypothetical protein